MPVLNHLFVQPELNDTDIEVAECKEDYAVTKISVKPHSGVEKLIAIVCCPVKNVE